MWRAHPGFFEKVRELWVSEGTEAGTQLTRNFQAVHSFENFVDFNGTLFFERKLLPIRDVGLWKSDGTEEGTELVKTFETDRDLDHLTVIDDTLFFTRNDPEGQLWKSDGTTEGTVIIADGLGIAGNIEEVVAVGETLFFNVRDEEVGDELWKSDGTTEGTQLVKDIRPGEQQAGSTINLGSTPRSLIDVDGTLFFTAYDGNARGLWKSDGTVEGTQLVRNFIEGEESNDAFRDFVEVDGTLYFTANFDSGLSLWKSDGTAEGTVQIEPEEIDLAGNVVDSFRFSNTAEEIAEFDDQLFFSGQAFDENEGEYVRALLTLSDSEENGQGDVEEQPDGEDGDITGTTVYRFFNTNSDVHFYTPNEAERDAVQELSNFNFEGGSYLGVDPLTGQPEPVPVYRFLNQDTGVHLYTISETERDVVGELDNFSFEGEAFFAYESEVEGSIPIYRFFNSTSGAHFYTPSAGERDNVEANLPEFQSEGIAYYALPLPE